MKKDFFYFYLHPDSSLQVSSDVIVFRQAEGQFTLTQATPPFLVIFDDVTYKWTIQVRFGYKIFVEFEFSGPTDTSLQVSFVFLYYLKIEKKILKGLPSLDIQRIKRG